MPGLWCSWDIWEHSSWTPWALEPLGKLPPSLLTSLLWEHVSWRLLQSDNPGWKVTCELMDEAGVGGSPWWR